MSLLAIVSVNLAIPASSTKDEGCPQVMPRLDSKLNGTRLWVGSLCQTRRGRGESDPCVSLPGRRGLLPSVPVHTLAPQHQTGNLFSVKLGNDK